MEALRGSCSLDEVPNLTYRAADGSVKENPLSYVPASLEYLGDNYRYAIRSVFKYRDWKSPRAFWNWWRYPITIVLTCRGCTRDCAFCGGSSSAMLEVCGRRQPAFRPPEKIAYDVSLISKFTSAPIFLVGDLLQGGRDFAMSTVELMSQADPKNHLVFELFSPAPREFLERIGSSFDNFDLQISPESHDPEIRELLGKEYDNEELERNIAWALEAGCKKLDVFFMIGLPGQTRDSVLETVEYCARLLRKFGPRLNPFIGPLAPFIDPGCPFHRHPDRYGIRLIHRTLEDYAQATLSPHWRDMLGYETRWMTRQEIVDVTYEALLEKASNRFTPVDRDGDDLAMIMYTSGTTAQPKGVMLTHRNLGSNAYSVVETNRVTADEVALSALPLSHSYGLTVSLLPGIRGLSCVLMRWFDAEEVFRCTERYHIRSMTGVPTMFIQLLNHPHAERYNVRAVPLTVIDDSVAIPGMIPEQALVEQVVRAARPGAPEGETPAGPTNEVAPRMDAGKAERGKQRPSGLIIP